jgi:hypothetical protein
MRHVTAETIAQDNERYRSLLEANGWTLKVGDALVNQFPSSTSKRAGTSNIANDLPLLTNDSTIYLVESELPGIEGLDLFSSTGWKTTSVKLRTLGDKPLQFRGNPNSNYAALRLYGPKNFDVDFRCNLLKRGFEFNNEGGTRNAVVLFNTDKGNGSFKLCGFKIKGGGFNHLRLFEPGSDTDSSLTKEISGLLEDFELDGSTGEPIYAGVRHKFHTIFKNTYIRNGLILTPGCDVMQIEALGDGSIIENITVGRSQAEFVSPFQNFQQCTFQIKAGGGSAKIRNILIESGGSTVFNTFSASPVKDASGNIIQDGAKPGDVMEISNIYVDKLNGSFLYQSNTCVNGATWVFDNIHLGTSSTRIATDTGTAKPYAYLTDPAGTENVIFKNITTEKGLPLTGKYGYKYTIENHVLVDRITRPKFVKPFFPDVDLFRYYKVYNEVSQQQFYPVAGQPVKFKAGDVVYTYAPGQPRRFFKSDIDQVAVDSIPGAGFTEVPYEYDYTQTSDSPLLNIAGLPQTDPKAERIKQLEQANDLLSAQLSAAINVNELFRVKLTEALAQYADALAQYNTANTKLTTVKTQLQQITDLM